VQFLPRLLSSGCFNWGALAVIRYREINFFAAIILALGFILPIAGEGAANETVQTVTGGKAAWTSELTGDWLGGNEKQLQDNAKNPDTSPAIAEKLQSLLPKAKLLDVVYEHIDFGGSSSKIDALLEVRAPVVDQINLADKAVRANFWKHLSDTINKDEGSTGSQTELEWEKTSATGGFPAYTALFKLTQPNRATEYFIRHFVTRERDVHPFQLGAFGNIDARVKEFDRFVHTVRYLR
jgi:hypothetical protein